MNDTKYTQTVAISWGDAKSKLTSLGPGWVFRGQRKSERDLQSSLERLHRSMNTPIEPNVAENLLLRQFMRKAHHYLAPSHLPSDSLEWLALMQHYGTPTRLLDWTRSPYIAAYFAVEDAKEIPGDSAVWAINLEWCKTRAVRQAREIMGDNTLELSSDFGAVDLFNKLIIQNQIDMVVPVAPFRVNDRLSVQQGLFLCPGNINRSFMDNLCYDEEGLKRSLLKIVIPNHCRLDALGDLNSMNINRTSLFPGLEGYAHSLKYSLEILNASDQIRDKLERGLTEAFLLV